MLHGGGFQAFSKPFTGHFLAVSVQKFSADSPNVNFRAQTVGPNLCYFFGTWKNDQLTVRRNYFYGEFLGGFKCGYFLSAKPPTRLFHGENQGVLYLNFILLWYGMVPLASLIYIDANLDNIIITEYWSVWQSTHLKYSAVWLIQQFGIYTNLDVHQIDKFSGLVDSAVWQIRQFGKIQQFERLSSLEYSALWQIQQFGRFISLSGFSGSKLLNLLKPVKPLKLVNLPNCWIFETAESVRVLNIPNYSIFQTA